MSPVLRVAPPSTQESDRTTGASSILAFCKAHSIARATFYNLMKRGLAPNPFFVGRRRLVSDESARDWRRRMEELTDARPTQRSKAS
jgi:predicted DNA-binding transcriptional regulator AlpA